MCAIGKAKFSEGLCTASSWGGLACTTRGVKARRVHRTVRAQDTIEAYLDLRRQPIAESVKDNANA